MPVAVLHIGVIRPTGALGHRPDDVLRRVLDVAGLAVHAVLGVDLQARPLVLLHDLVDTGRAVALLGRIEIRQVVADRDRWIFQPEVDRLILLMVGVRKKNG